MTRLKPSKPFKTFTQTCTALLRRCAADRSLLPAGLAVHALVLKSGISSHRAISSKLLTMYTFCGFPADRDRVFNELPTFNLLVWNNMISSCAATGDLERARQLFDKMPDGNIVTWTLMSNALMKHGRVHEALHYFENNPAPSVVSWTAMISGLVGNGLSPEALLLFRRMLRSGLLPNQITFTSMIKACITSSNLVLGWSVVGLIVKTNFECDLSVCNAMITLCQRTGDAALARRVFDEMEERDVVSWTALLAQAGDLREASGIFGEMPKRNEVSWSTMIARCRQNGEPLEALKLFDRMLRDGYKPNVSCFSSMLSASADLGNLGFGTSIHCHAIKAGFESDNFITSSLIDMYCSCQRCEDAQRVFELSSEKNIVCWNSMVVGYSCDGKIEEAEEIFKKMPVRDKVTWNAMISGYVQNECFGKAVEVFDDMLISGHIPNGMTFSSALQACANLPSLDKGRSLHGKIVKLGIQREVYIGTALTGMYAKSGDIESSKRVFSEMPEKNEISWTVMIQGLAESGLAEECLVFFEKMRRTKAMTPNDQIFLSILFACSHRGLVDKGFHYFESMAKDYGISPKEKHYTCIVDLLARAGRLREAEEFISKMPLKPEANAWAALLSGCSSRRNEEIGERAARRLWDLEKDNPASYVLLSNIYASAGRWKDVVRVRARMGETGLRKGVGCSWIQTRDRFHTFVSGDISHAESLKIYGIL